MVYKYHHKGVVVDHPSLEGVVVEVVHTCLEEGEAVAGQPTLVVGRVMEPYLVEGEVVVDHS